MQVYSRVWIIIQVCSCAESVLQVCIVHVYSNVWTIILDCPTGVHHTWAVTQVCSPAEAVHCALVITQVYICTQTMTQMCTVHRLIEVYMYVQTIIQVCIILRLAQRCASYTDCDPGVHCTQTVIQVCTVHRLIHVHTCVQTNWSWARAAACDHSQVWSLIWAHPGVTGWLLLSQLSSLQYLVDRAVLWPGISALCG